MFDENDPRNNDNDHFESPDNPNDLYSPDKPDDEMIYVSEEDMTDSSSKEPKTVGEAIKKGLLETVDTFVAFVKSPSEIIGLNIINVIEGMAYFGVLTYLVLYMHENVGLSDVHASWVVTAFMMLVTISQLLFGGVSDKLGARRALGISLIVLTLGRFALGFAEPLFGAAGNGLNSQFFIVTACALGFVALSYGLYQPSIYTVTRQYSDEKTSAVSYALLYAGMNLGAFITGLVLPHIRKASADSMPAILPDVSTISNGISGSLIFLATLMVAALICYYFFILRSKTKIQNPDKKEKNDSAQPNSSRPLTKAERLANYILTHPLFNLRFDYFIFILIPVQTLFAYQNILIPTYLKRCFTEYPTISDNYETFSNLNPIIVFIAAPIIAALTAKSNVYKMMIIGTTVMAAPTFLLAIDQNPYTFLTFVLIMSIGESMWQPRFLQHVAEIAPKERVGAYIGIAQLPWFLTKFIVGWYVGFFMENYIPETGTQYPEMMWLIFAAIAMVSPVGLFVARKWCNIEKKDMDEKQESVNF